MGLIVPPGVGWVLALGLDSLLKTRSQEALDWRGSSYCGKWFGYVLGSNHRRLTMLIIFAQRRNYAISRDLCQSVEAARL